MCKYCDSDNVRYEDFHDCDNGEELPLFKHRIIDEGYYTDTNDDISSCVVGIVGNELVLRMPSTIGYDRCDITIMGTSIIKYCPMCGKRLKE